MNEKWYLDSGCSRHMTGDRSKFSHLQEKDGGMVSFGGKDKGKIIGTGKVRDFIDDVLLVEGLNHNLLSISQLCDKGYGVTFDKSHCSVFEKCSNEIKFFEQRVNNVYIVDFENVSSDGLCLVADFGDAPWLWHRRLGHASFGVISKLSWHDLVNGLPKVNFSSDKICEACAKGKQTRASFKAFIFPSSRIALS